MQQLCAARLLDAWERGRRRSGLGRALLLLAAGEPPEAALAVASQPIGRRDTEILDIRVSLFGPHLDALVTCPACGELLEFAMAASDIPRSRDVDLPATLSISSGGYEIAFRLPTSEDLAAVAPRPDPERRSALFERCVIDARREGTPIGADAIPEFVVNVMLERMVAIDPGANLKILLSCPGCGHEWQSAFDIASFLWAEVDAWAVRTLHQVHTLASAYGWSEADVLAMSAWRRHRYIEMASG